MFALSAAWPVLHIALLCPPRPVSSEIHPRPDEDLLVLALRFAAPADLGAPPAEAAAASCARREPGPRLACAEQQ